MNIEGVLVRDLKKDTLLYAGKIKVRVTDWFIFKDKAELKYIGLEDAVINQYRYDSIWNHQFLIDYFDPPKKDTAVKKKKKENSGGSLELDLKKIDLKNVSFVKNDLWKGQKMTVRVGSLLLDAKKIDFAKNDFAINYIEIDKPYFSQIDFEGRRPFKPKKLKSDTGMYFNEGGIKLMADSLRITNGQLAFENDKKFLNNKGVFDGGHIIMNKLNGSFTKVSFINDTIKANVDLTVHERCGLDLKKLKANFKLTPQIMEFDKLDLRTNKSELRDYYAMKFTDFNEDFAEYITNVLMDARFKNSSIHSDDIAYFAPALKDIHQKAAISGNSKGTVTNFSINNLFVGIGNTTYLSGNVSMKGLPDIDKTFITLTNGNIQTNYADATVFYKDLASIKSPNLPALGNVRYKGDFKGTITDFVTNGTMSSNQGSLFANVSMKLPKSKGQEPSYVGRITTQQFNIGKLLNSTALGNISFDGDIDGSSFLLEKLKTKFTGKVNSIEANGYTYQNLKLNGTFQKKYFTGEFESDDKSFNLISQVEIDFTGDQPKFNIVGDLVQSNLKNMNLTRENLQLSGLFDVNFTGTNIDNFLGEAKLLNASIKDDSTTLSFDSLTINSAYIQDRKTLSVTSNEFAATLSGDFKVLDLPNSFQSFLHRYYPAYIGEPNKVPSNQDFTVTLKTKDIDPYVNLFTKDLSGLNFITLKGGVNTKENKFSIDADIPFLKYKQYAFQNARINSKGTLDSLKIIADIDNVFVTDSLFFPSTKINITSSNDYSAVNIKTKASNTLNEADLNAFITTLEDGVSIELQPSTFVLNDKKWSIDKRGDLVIRKKFLSAKDIVFTQGFQQIDIKTRESNINNDQELVVNLTKVNISDFTTLGFKNPRIEGVATGTITMNDFFGQFNAETKLQIEQFRLDNDSIGLLTVNAGYDSKTGVIDYLFDSQNLLYNFMADGTYNIKDSVGNPLNTNIKLDNTEIGLLQKFFTGLFSDLKGQAYGNLTIKGSPANLNLLGKVKLKNAGIKVDFTQVYYTIDSANFEFKEGLMDFGRFTIKDTLGKTGTVIGKLYHQSFKKMRFDFDMNTSSMLLIDTKLKDNQQFYGRAIGKATLSLKGSEENLYMNITAEPTDTSHIVLPNSAGKESGDADFIRFKQYGTEMLAQKSDSKTNLIIDLDLTANNKVGIDVVMDDLTGDVIQATGNGKLKIHAGTSEEMTMRGRYNIERGSYNFSFQSFIRKPFDLKKDAGNYIEWTGNATDAILKIDAQYTAENVKLETLLPSNQQQGTFDAVKGYKGQVYVIGELRGRLSKPDIKFYFDFPETSPVRNDFALAQLLSRIKADDNETLKQVAFLVVFNNFSTYQGNAAVTVNAGDIGINTVSSLIAKGLNTIISDLFTKVFKTKDIKLEFNPLYNTNINTIGGNTSTESGLKRSNFSLKYVKSLANDRIELYFGSDFDFLALNASQVATTQSSFVFLPDFRVEFILNEKRNLRLVAFYKDNIDLTTTAGKRNRTGISFTFRKDLLDAEEKRERELYKKMQRQVPNKPPETPTVEEDKTVTFKSDN